MTFSRMEAAREDAFVGWFNTFKCKSHHIDTVVELSDGVVLSDILTDVDGKWFKQIPKQTDTQVTWVQRFNNQTLIYKLITRYFEEVLGQDPELLPTVNLEAIAKNADLHELLLMCQLVIAIAVQSDNNRMYIEMIQNLPQKSQQVLMVSIEEVMIHFDVDQVDSRSGTSANAASRSYYADSDLPSKGHIDIDKILSDKKQYEAVHSQLLREYDDLHGRFIDLSDEKADIERRLQDMDSAITQANDTGITDWVMRAELDHVRQDLVKSEDKRHEMELILDQHVQSIHELERKIDDLTLQTDQNNTLRNQLEGYQETVERLELMEDALNKYKRKVEEGGDLRRHIKALEEQNTSLTERSHRVEDEYRKVLAFKTLMDSYKLQVQQLESSHMEILKEKDRLDAQVASLAEQSTCLEDERDRRAEEVQTLEDHIKELELVGTGVTLDKVVDTGEPMDLDCQNDFEENLRETNAIELRLTIGRLKRQIKEMEEAEILGSGVSGVDSITVQGLQDAKKSLEKEHKAILLERDQLRQELIEIRNGVPGSLANPQTIRSRILDLEKESAYLKIQSGQLEMTVTEGTSSVTKDPVTFQQYEQEHGRIQDQLDRLEDTSKMQLHELNRVLVEAKYLNGINNQPSDNVDQPGLSNDDLELIMEDNATSQAHIVRIHKVIEDSQVRNRKIHHMVKLYGQLLQEMTARFALGNHTGESFTLLSKIPRSKEDEQNMIKKQIHGVRQQLRMEQQLIISSWYDLAYKNQRELSNLSIRSSPSSWLGRQRKVLDSHLRQKIC